ncbi:restriction endonuclease subunit S [Streptomyces sp. VRA16 Mangrove soil]|uniref:restriction endonuclease subunit S n=1 Tax=Streptomyces sp. VRA16 Mangrove soil TaxID=2817434 RepID=UPI001A9F5DF6|nr:restriction endonuclease subunit S [Streptomyces sp. VRA16 Mangrove soil]MBO1334614.1 restriction endonuclease subunit S [Streptomyces sp. VRA16 Mangrove soil]
MAERTTSTFLELIHRGVLEIGDGYRAKNSELDGDGLPFMRAGNLTDQGWKTDGLERFHRHLADKISGKVSRHGDTVITTKGNSTGRTGYVAPGMAPFVYSPHLSFWRTLDPCQIDARYLRYWAIGPEMADQLASMAHGTDMAPYLSLSDQKRLRISLPEISQQRAIGAILGALDDKIAVNERIAVTADELALALALDERWEKRIRLGEIADLSKVQQVPQEMSDDLVDHYSLPAFDSGKAPDRCSPLSIKSGKFVIDSPAVLLSKLNPEIPRAWDVVPDRSVPSLASTEFLVLVPGLGISTHELWSVVAQRKFLEELAAKVTGTSKSHQRVRPAEVMETEVVDPRQFGEVGGQIRSLAQSILAARRESKTLATLRDTLLPQLMSGRLRVKDAEKIVEDHV